MSDLMLTAVLSMPYDMAMADDLSRRQFYDRAQQALEEIERLTKSEQIEAQIEGWQLLADLVAGLEATHWSSWQTTAHFDSALDAARAALAAKDNGNAGE